MFVELLKNYGLPVLGGALFLTGSWVFAYWVDKIVRRMIAGNAATEQSFVPLIARVARYSIIVLASIAVLDELGVEIASLVAALGIFGFAIAIGLRTTTNNFFCGVMLMILEPYKKGEHIEGERVEGIVEDINFVHTTVVTKDGILVTVPNGAMWARSVRNHSRPRPHCVEIDVTLDRGHGIDELRALIEQALRSEPMIFTGYEPLIRVQAVKKSTITIRTSIWCAAENEFEVRERTSAALQEKLGSEGVKIRKIGPPRAVKPKKKRAPIPPEVEDGT